MSSRARVVCLLAATLVAVAVASPAMASLVDALTLLQSGQNNLTDVSGDLLVNGANGTSSTSQLVTKGSILLSAFSETQINGSNYGLPTETEISGVAALQVLAQRMLAPLLVQLTRTRLGPRLVLQIWPL